MSLPLGRVDPYHWRFVLVPTGMREVFLKQSGRGKMRSLGKQVAGFMASLALGDGVYTRGKDGRLRLMFRLTFHPRRKYAAIKFGRGWGSRPGQYRKLDELSSKAFANAGEEPAEEVSQ